MYKKTPFALSGKERVKQIVLEMTFYYHLSFSHFFLQIQAKTLSQRSMFTPLSVDIFVLLTPKKEYHRVTSSVNTQNNTKKKNPKTSKVLIIFWVKNITLSKKRKRQAPTRLIICLPLRRGCELCLASAKTFCGYLSVLCCNSVIITLQ